jgi:DNA mismatch repair protein MutL
MGFRGEALASIAAISKVEMISKTEDQETGYRVTAEGGDVTDKSEYASYKGTTITIRELFFNTPVRYKFLKKDFTETGYIEEVVQRIALSHPEIAIKLIDTGKTTIQTNGNGNLEDTIYSIYGRETVDNLLPVDYTYEETHITGVIGKPILSRSNRTNQLFYVNHRYIKDKTLTSAADQGFKGLVTIGKHGFLILNLDMDPKKVDVNVHPTKLEVRFQEESKVFKAVYHAIKETLLKGDLISDPNKDYSEEKENKVSQNITNATRKEVWSITDKTDKKEETVAEEKTDENEKIPELSEFKNTMENLSEENKKEFINQINNAQTTEEMIETLNKFKAMQETPAPVEETNEEEKDEDTEKESEVKEEIKEIKEETTFEEEEKEDKEIEETKDVEENKEESEDELVDAKDIEINPEGIDENDNAEIKITGMVDDADEAGRSEETEAPEVEIPEPEHEETVEEDRSKSETSENNIKEKEEVVEEETTEEESFEEMYKKLFKHDLGEAQKEYSQKLKAQEEENPITPLNGEEISMFEKEGLDKNPKYNFIGIAFKTYIIFTIKDDLYLLDQHAAHERIMYEKVKANYGNEEQKDSQLMLVPDIINLNNKEMGIYRDNKEMFNKAGFITDEFGDNTVKLTGVPEFCLKFNTQELFLETLDEIDTVARTAKQEIEDKFLATIACKAAVKAHMALT